MSRLTVVFRLTTHLTAASALILTMGAVAHALPVMINNGSAPPNPENVIDAADDYSGDDVYVRNVGCPPGWPAVFPDDPCASPGAVTAVEVVSGGSVDNLHAYDSSTVTMTGGTVGTQLHAYDSSTVTMTGGSVGTVMRAEGSATVTLSGGSIVDALLAYDTSTIEMSDGSVGGDLFAYDSSIITFIGSDFMVNDELVPYGDLSALTGTLTGTLALGGSLDNLFYQGGYAGTYTGTIRLVPEPSTGLLLAFGLVALAAGRRRRAL